MGSNQTLDERSDRIAETTVANEERFAVYERILDALHDNLWTGVGYGCFAEAFRLYRESGIEHVFLAGHNTYGENLLELGLPAGGVEGGFSAEVKINSGGLLLAAQVVINQTNDPAFIAGAIR